MGTILFNYYPPPPHNTSQLLMHGRIYRGVRSNPPPPLLVKAKPPSNPGPRTPLIGRKPENIYLYEITANTRCLCMLSSLCQIKSI